MNLIQRFRRSSGSVSFVPEIDGLRFFCIFLVMIFHLNTSMHRANAAFDAYWESKLLETHSPSFWEQMQNIAWWIARMDLGVKVFFAISGYILAMPFLKYYLFDGKKIDIKNYLIRRLTRLEPPFIISLLVLFLMQVLLMHKSVGEYFAHFIAGIAYMHKPIYGIPNPINPVTWSLETEAQFYLSLPILLSFIFLFRKSTTRVLVTSTLFIVFFIFKYVISENQWNHLDNSIFYYFSFFAIGTLYALANLLQPERFFSGTKKYMYDGLGIVAVFMLFYFYKPQQSILNNILFNLGVFGLFWAAFRGIVFNRFFTTPIIYLIGGMCYSIYLLHYAIFFILIPYTINLSSNMSYTSSLIVQSAILFPAMLLIAGAFYLLIEKPCMNKDWPQQLLTKLGFRKSESNR